jgi:hypothetical protein
MSALRKRHAELHAALLEQVDLLREALMGADAKEALVHVEAMMRGCEQVRQAMLVDRVKELWPGAEVVAVRPKDQLAPGE